MQKTSSRINKLFYFLLTISFSLMGCIFSCNAFEEDGTILTLNLPLECERLINAPELTADRTKIVKELKVLHNLEAEKQSQFYKQWCEFKERINQFSHLEILDLSEVHFIDEAFLKNLKDDYPDIKVLERDTSNLPQPDLKNSETMVQEFFEEELMESEDTENNSCIEYDYDSSNECSEGNAHDS